LADQLSELFDKLIPMCFHVPVNSRHWVRHLLLSRPTFARELSLTMDFETVKNERHAHIGLRRRKKTPELLCAVSLSGL
jgi:hypothetical protein